ncbi:hypothetical protein HanRHA438_Chr11g0519411 [Helianthus annuus]|nr:hypothetical protein HanRHA438_Chr11g0519411 [Helianthus annuus]
MQHHPHELSDWIHEKSDFFTTLPIDPAILSNRELSLICTGTPRIWTQASRSKLMTWPSHNTSEEQTLSHTSSFLPINSAATRFSLNTISTFNPPI